jgi:hypothetical protein
MKIYSAIYSVLNFKSLIYKEIFFGMECVLYSRNSQQPGAMPLAVLRSPRWGFAGATPLSLFMFYCSSS